MVVPQSGPITIKPLSAAFCFKRISSSNVTLSEKIITFKSRSNAESVNSAAYSPAIEINTVLASGILCTAEAKRLAFGIRLPLPPWFLAKFANSSSNAATITSTMLESTVSALIAIQMSFGVASSKSGLQKPVACNKSLFAGVPIMTEISSTSGCSLSLREINIKLTES